MPRKKWTPQADISDDLIQLRLKRKWQIAFRRYVMGETQSLAYASFFGLDVVSLRRWIEIQFTQAMHWDNFSDAWHFDHLVPVSIFDFTRESDLRLCWNFINIRPKALGDSSGDLMGFQLKEHFHRLFRSSGNAIAEAMVSRLSTLESLQQVRQREILAFLENQQPHILNIQKLSPEELHALNQGKSIADILAEQAFLKKFS